MKALPLAFAAGVLLAASSAAPLATGRHAAVALVRVPQGGIQPEAALDPRGTLHLLYFVGEPRR